MGAEQTSWAITTLECWRDAVETMHSALVFGHGFEGPYCIFGIDGPNFGIIWMPNYPPTVSPDRLRAQQTQERVMSAVQDPLTFRSKEFLPPHARRAMRDKGRTQFLMWAEMHGVIGTEDSPLEVDEDGHPTYPGMPKYSARIKQDAGPFGFSIKGVPPPTHAHRAMRDKGRTQFIIWRASGWSFLFDPGLRATAVIGNLFQSFAALDNLPLTHMSLQGVKWHATKEDCRLGRLQTFLRKNSR